MCDEADLHMLILSMKQEILQKIESRNAETEKNINDNINNIKQDVQANKEEIIKIYEKLEKLENRKENDDIKQTYAEAVKKDILKNNFLTEARKIIGLIPIKNSDIGQHMKDGNDVKVAMMAADDDFLHLELKMDDDEVRKLDTINITCPQKEETERVYIYTVRQKKDLNIYTGRMYR